MTAWRRRAAIAAAMTAMLVVGRVTDPPRPAAAESGPEAFVYIYKVATHPRCVNCHGTGKGEDSVPLVGDGMEPHPMNITIRHNVDSAGKLGIDCGTCHQDRMLPDRATPPGFSNGRMDMPWQMPKPDRDWMRVAPTLTDKGLTEGQRQRKVCEAWNRFREEKGDDYFRHHIADDPLVEWALTPNLGREPAPGGLDRLKAKVNTWIGWMRSGGSCDELARPATPAEKPR